MKKTINKIKQEAKKWKNFMIASIVLTIFFGLNYFHEWANNFIINLHFCNHTFCIIFAIIWLGFAFFSWKNKKAYLKIAIIILVIGIILMNLATCDASGSMSFGDFSLGNFAIFSSLDNGNGEDCTPGVDCPGDIVEVPIPPCIETDDGRDYITPGMILSGANLEDMCMGTDILRERYCNSELTYTSEDVSCSDLYGVDWICEDRECILSETPIIPEPEIGNETDCGDGVDNDGDGLIDCADPDCDYAFEDGGCGDFEYSCEHLSDYPTCGGTCPVGSVCGIYNTGDGTLDGGWCECIPEGEVSCYDSGDCTGWCDEGYEYICVGDEVGCYCEWLYNFDICIESDDGVDPLVGGFVFFTPLNLIDYCESKFDEWLMEYSCGDVGIISQSIDCSELGLVCLSGFGEGDYCGEGEL